MSEIKRKWEHLSFYDHSGIAAHLEKMALRGWMVEQPGSWIWKYRRIEPRKLHFAVTYFPDALSLRKDPTADQEMMEELCQRDGWKLAARWCQMQIFYNEQEDPAPIETDPVITVETIRRTMRKGAVNSMAESLVFDLIMCVGLIYKFFKAPVQFLSSSFAILFLLGWTLMVAKSLIDLGLYHSWSRKAARDAQEGVLRPVRRLPVLTGGLETVSDLLILGAFLSSPTTRVTGLLAVGAVLVPVLANLIYARSMRRRGVPRQTMVKRGMALSLVLFVLTFVGMTWYIAKVGLPSGSPVVGTGQRWSREVDIYANRLPLRLEDLVETGERQWSTRAKARESALVAYTEYEQMELGEEGELLDLDYRVTEVKVDSVYNYCKDKLLSERKDEVQGGEVVFVDHYEPIDPAPWKAKEAYQCHFSSSVLDTYLLCYEDRIVELSLHFTPDERQMAVVAEKLA